MIPSKRSPKLVGQVLLGGLLVGIAPGSAWAGAPSAAARFAIVIGNNRVENGRGSDLRYADDDAVATHQLLTDAGVDSTLLVSLDEDSQRLYRDLGPHGAPRERDLDDTFRALSEKMRAVAQRGVDTELLIFYSGHGDVQEGGEGYVVLEDGRLTRTKLHDLLARSPAAHNHVFVDACRSYFLVFDRGPGGERQPYTQPFGDDAVPARLSNTGFVLSTSSGRDSHEWERYQGGILSYELRSALRGAADADGDGRVTYSELGAFLETANQSIPNARFRPDFMVRPPAENRQQEVLRWTNDAAPLRVDGSLGHIYIESARGERLLDAHPNTEQTLTLHVPPTRPLFVRQSDEAAERKIRTRGPVDVSLLRPTRPEIARRGAADLAFEALFASPFGRRDVVAFERRAGVQGNAPEAGSPRWPSSSGGEVPPDLMRERGTWSAWRVGRVPRLRGEPISDHATAVSVPVTVFDADADRGTSPFNPLPQVKSPRTVCYAVAGGRIDLGLDKALAGPFLVCGKEAPK